MGSARVLLLDIETAPGLYYAWGGSLYEQNLIETEKPWYMLSFAAKWLGEKKTECRTLPEFSRYKKDKSDDGQLCAALHERLDEADIVIAHNGDRFDLKKVNARLIFHGFGPPSPYKSIDTLKIARRYFGFTSNRLDDLAGHLGVGRKLAHTGKHLWLGCMSGDMPSWKIMKQYNVHDVDPLLEGVYLKLRAWHASHPDLNLYDDKPACPTCQSTNVQRRGIRVAVKKRYERMQCQECGHWWSGKAI